MTSWFSILRITLYGLYSGFGCNDFGEDEKVGEAEEAQKTSKLEKQKSKVVRVY